MRLVRSIATLKIFFLVAIISVFVLQSQGQDNAPYTRFGLGAALPQQNVVSRGMGGLTAAYTDYQSINFVNPAAIASIRTTIFDVGGDVLVHSLKSNTSPDKYSSTNANISYIQLGVLLSSPKAAEKKKFWALNFGLRPITRISYKIQENDRLTGIDSVQYLYEGSGGVNRFNLGTAIKIDRFAAGISLGYDFGNRTYSSKLILINDSVQYYKSNIQNSTNFSSLSVTAGVQYEFPKRSANVNERKELWRIGAYGTLPANFKATQDKINETYSYDGSGSPFTIDTVQFNSKRGTIKYPASYGIGFTFTDKYNHWTFGADYESMLWSNYKYFDSTEGLQNSFRAKAGVQYYPAKDNTLATRYFSFVKYRLGFYYGVDAVKIAGDRNEYGFTLGAAFPLTSLQRLRFGDFAMLNTALEFGGIGNKKSGSIRENIIRFNFGVSMNARWFQKRKYD